VRRSGGDPGCSEHLSGDGAEVRKEAKRMRREKSFLKGWGAGSKATGGGQGLCLKGKNARKFSRKGGKRSKWKDSEEKEGGR